MGLLDPRIFPGIDRMAAAALRTILAEMSIILAVTADAQR